MISPLADYLSSGGLIVRSGGWPLPLRQGMEVRPSSCDIILPLSSSGAVHLQTGQTPRVGCVVVALVFFFILGTSSVYESDFVRIGNGTEKIFH